jgi:competence protein ComEC
MQRQLEQIIVAATLAFLLGCHAGLSKLLPLIPALILAALFLLLLAWCCRQNAGVKLLAAAGIGLCFCCGAASGSGAMRQPQLPLQTFTGQEVRIFGRVEAGSVKVTPQGTSLVLACHTL